MKTLFCSIVLMLAIAFISFAQKGIPIYHTVKKGETIRSIANKYHTTTKAVSRLNNKIAFGRLKPGLKIIVRYATKQQVQKAIETYKIKKGENLRLVARNLGISVATLRILLDNNNLHLKEGTEISLAEENKNIKSINGIEDKTETNSVKLVDKFKSDIDVEIPQTNIKKPNAIAVIIGNKNYTGSDVPEVSYAHRDAQTMKDYFTKTLGYDEGNILYVEDATQATLFSIFGNETTHKGKLFDYVRPNESEVFVYYSGHGGPDPETKNAYFIPTDCDPSQLALNGYSLNTFYKNLSLLPYKSLTVIIDACFSGVSEGGALLKNISPIFINTENKIKLDENALVINASASNQVASWYPEKQHSLLSYFLMKGMQGEADLNKNKEISVKELEKYLLKEVPYWARRLHSREQNPEIWGVPDHTFSTY